MRKPGLQPAPSAPPAQYLYEQFHQPGLPYGRMAVYGEAAAVAVPPPPAPLTGSATCTHPLLGGDLEEAKPSVELATNLTYLTPAYGQGLGDRFEGYLHTSVSAENKQRVSTIKSGVDKLATGWGYFVISLGIALGRTHQLRGLQPGADFMPIVDKMLRDLLILACVFVAHKLLYARSSHSRATFLQENALHAPELVDHRDVRARGHDSRRSIYSYAATALNAGSMAVMGYAAYRFALADPEHAKDNLMILGGGMALEFFSSTLQCWSEQRRAKSMTPDLSVNINISGISLLGGVASMVMFIAAAVTGSYNTGEHYSYDKTLASALLCTLGAGLVSSIVQRAGAELSAQSAASKLAKDPKLNAGQLNLGVCKFNMKESTRQRWEEILFKALIFSAVFTTKRYSSLIPVLAHIVAVSVAGMLIGKSREVRSANLHTRVQQARRGDEPSAGLDEVSRVCRIC